MMTQPEEIICSICGGGPLVEHRGKPVEKCMNCGSRPRHRLGHYLYKELLSPFKGEPAKCLHLAPESCFTPLLTDIFGSGYVPADANPARYPHVKALELLLPEGFDVFAEGYFSVILHNHVLEHIPGHYKDHIDAFLRVLAPGGLMIMSVPGPYYDKQTVEGGEHMSSDQERLDTFFQEDHLKILGKDFVEYLEQIDNVEILPDNMTNEIRSSLHVRPNKAPFFILRKTS